MCVFFKGKCLLIHELEIISGNILRKTFYFVIILVLHEKQMYFA